MTQLIYSGPFLRIQFDQLNSLFIQAWQSTDKLSASSFKDEMLKYTEEYKKFRPETSLWLQEGFSLTLGRDDFLWIEKNVNIPCFDYGNKKLAFVIGKQIEEDVSVIKSFEEPLSCIVPRYFAQEKEARDWLLGIKNIDDVSNDDNSLEISMVNHDNGKTTFEVVSPTNDIKQSMLSLNSILEKENFRKKHCDSFENLTKTERRVLRLLGQCYSTSEIGEESNTSVYTVRAHIRNLKNKLGVGREAELVSFAKIYF